MKFFAEFLWVHGAMDSDKLTPGPPPRKLVRFRSQHHMHTHRRWTNSDVRGIDNMDRAGNDNRGSPRIARLGTWEKVRVICDGYMVQAWQREYHIKQNMAYCSATFQHIREHSGNRKRAHNGLTILLVCIPLSRSFSGAGPYTANVFSPVSWTVMMEAMFPQR